MRFADKAHDISEKGKGKVKEAVGDATDNARLTSEGLEQQMQAEAHEEEIRARREAEELLDADNPQHRIR